MEVELQDLESSEIPPNALAQSEESSKIGKCSPQFALKLFKSFMYCVIGMTYAMNSSILNWSIDKYARMADIDDTWKGYIFAIRGVGYIFGSFLSGPVYGLFKVLPNEKVRWYKLTAHKVYVLMCIILAACIAIIPLFGNIWAILINYFINGAACGFLETGGSIFMVYLWKKKADPALILINFSFGVGSFVSPLIGNRLLNDNPNDFSGMSIGHWIHAGILVVSVIPFLFLTTPPALVEEKEKNSKEKMTWKKGISSLCTKRVWITILCAIFVGFQTGALVSFAGLIMDYSVKRELTNVQGGTLLASSIWIAITLTRLLLIPIATFVNSNILLFLSLIGCIISIIIMIIFRTLVAVWIGTIAFGVSIASQYPLVLGYPLTLGIITTAEMTAVIIVGAAIGKSVVPLAITSLFPILGYESLFWLVLGCGVFAFLDFAVIFFAFKFKCRRGVKNQRVDMEEQNQEDFEKQIHEAYVENKIPEGISVESREVSVADFQALRAEENKEDECKENQKKEECKEVQNIL